MGMKFWTRVAAAILLCLTTVHADPEPSTQGVALEVGGAAPPLSIQHWYKGEPVASFKPQQVYVVEFWATWCGPCKESIPHLTELQKQYGDKVTIIGVDVWEHPGDPSDAAITTAVNSFMEKMRDQMGYTVGGDGPAKTMSQAWLEAAGLDGIPAAFIVGRDGIVEWIGVGYPSGIDDALKGVVKGTWDRVAERKKEADQRIADAKRDALLSSLRAARESKDVAASQTALDAVIAADPDYRNSPSGIQCQSEIYMQSDSGKALRYVQQLTSSDGTLAKNPEFLRCVLITLPESPNSVITADTFKSMSLALSPLVKANPSLGRVEWRTFAQLQDNAGQYADAVSYEEKVIGSLETLKSDKNLPAATIEKIDAVLDKEKSKLGAFRAQISK